MFSYVDAGVGVGVGASLKWTATSFDKTSGEKRCETSFEGGSKSDAEKLSHASFQRCTSAFEFSFAGCLILHTGSAVELDLVQPL